MVNLMRQQAIAGLKAGDRFECKRTFTRAEVDAFGDLTRDYNPVHYDMSWTQAKGFDGLICHGLLVGAMICEFGGQVGWLATGMNFKFIKPAYIGDTITCAVTILSIEPSGRAEAEAVFANGRNQRIGQAHMTGRLPLPDERKLLQAMVAAGDVSNKLR